jgi:hypothetical protein
MPEEKPKTLADQLREVDDCEPHRCEVCGLFACWGECVSENWYFDEVAYKRMLG